MLLIRGFNEKRYAREIEKGKIGFRDLLSTLLYPENNGYKFSDYYEQSLIETALLTSKFRLDLVNTSPKIAEQLNLIHNPFIPHFYLSYFHILNKNSEKWLDENFDDNSYFIYAIPKLQKLDNMDEMLIGHNMIGSSMLYLPKDGIARTSKLLLQKAGIVYLMQNELDACKPYGSCNMEICMDLSDMISAICMEALARRCDEKYNDSENEFRMIYKTPTPYVPKTGFFEPIENRGLSIYVDGIKYNGQFIDKKIELDGQKYINHSLFLQTNNPIVNEPLKTLKQIIDEGKKFKILPHFKLISIKNVFSEYNYIGNKEQCRQFIANRLKTISI